MTWLDDVTLSTVLVHQHDGLSLRGLRYAVYDDCIVLRDAVLVEQESQEPLKGLIVIPRENVSFMQVLG